jgi:hypothetical protein
MQDRPVGASLRAADDGETMMKELLKRLLLFLIGLIAAAALGSIDWAPAARPATGLARAA